MEIYKPIRCPHCGSDNYDHFDSVGGCGETYEELYSCFDCDGQFRIVYEYKEMKKDD